MEVEERAQGANWRWPLLVCVVVFNVCLPSLVFSYGSLWVHLSNTEVPLWLGLATPTIFVLTYGLTQCWFREAADSWGATVGYRVMATIGLLLVVISLIICVFIPHHWQPFVYGILGGLGSSLISAQVDAVLFETYDSRLELIRGLCYTGQAVGQSVFPHIIYILIQYYGFHFSYLLLAAIVLQTLPAVFVLKVEKAKTPRYFTRYKEVSQTFMNFQNDTLDNFYGTEVQLHNLSKKCWKSPCDDNLQRVEEFDGDDGSVIDIITPPPSPEERRRNIFGVDILPEIPEESEEEYDDQSISSANINKIHLSFAIKRLSTLGDNIDGCITNQLRRDSQTNDGNESRDYSEVEVTYETVMPITDIQTEKLFNSFSFRCRSAYVNMKRKLWVPSYKIYRIKRRTLYLIYSINDIFFKPLTRSLSCGRFYPALLLYFTKLSLMAIGIVYLPFVGQQVRPKMALIEINFFMSLHGFTWLCFLLCTPWLAQTPKRNFKYVAVCGLIVSTCACFVLATATDQDAFSVGCVIAGLGYGAITSCWETTVQDFIGARKWSKIHSTLETSSAICLAFFSLGLSFTLKEKGGVQNSIFILGILTAIASFVWFVITAISIYKNKVTSFTFKRKCFF